MRRARLLRHQSPACRRKATLLLLETFGAWGPELTLLVQEMVDYRQGKFTAAEYDEATWSTRNFATFARQRISVALQKAAATEISNALGLPLSVDLRGPLL